MNNDKLLDLAEKIVSLDELWDPYELNDLYDSFESTPEHFHDVLMALLDGRAAGEKLLKRLDSTLNDYANDESQRSVALTQKLKSLKEEILELWLVTAS